MAHGISAHMTGDWERKQCLGEVPGRGRVEEPQSFQHGDTSCIRTQLGKEKEDSAPYKDEQKLEPLNQMNL